MSTGPRTRSRQVHAGRPALIRRFYQGSAALIRRKRYRILAESGKRHQGHPELFDPAHYQVELIKVDGFDNVAVRRRLVGGIHVLGELRSREDNHSDRAQRRITLDLAQHLNAVALRKVQIQQHQLRPGSGAELAAPVNEVDRLSAVGYLADPLRYRTMHENFAGKPRIGRAVFYQ